jgi:hypothetical protein
MYGRERRDWLCIVPLFWLGLRCVSAQGVGAQIIAAKGVFEVQWTRQSDGTWRISRLHSDAVENGR